MRLQDKIIIGASGGDQGVRNWLVALDAKTGNVQWKTYAVPAPGEPGSETWKDKHNAWQTGGGAFYVTGSYDPDTNITYWGAGNPAPKYDSSYRPGDNLYTNSALAIDAATGKIRWYHQYTPNDTMDYDESGSHILIDTKVNGEDRKIVTQRRAQRLRLQLRSLERPVPQGHAIRVEGDLDQGHRPEDRQAARLRSGQGPPDLCRSDRQDPDRRNEQLLSGRAGRQQFLVGGLQPQDRPSSTSRSSRPAPR